MSTRRLKETIFYIKYGFLYKKDTWVYTEARDWEHTVCYIFDAAACTWHAINKHERDSNHNLSINTKIFNSIEEAFVAYYHEICDDNFNNHKFLDLISELKINNPELFL